ncbi:MAG: superoxide dismutase [bacterium]|nr:superoxide dismutase [bacterium]
MAFELPPLQYPTTALEPNIDAMTMEIHHDRHHQAYVNNLNNALQNAPAEFQNMGIEDLLQALDRLPDNIRTAVRNNGGGHWNHTLFWEIMAPGGASAPSGDLAAAIDSAFGSLDGFKDQFKAKAVGQFGSGWAWLVVAADGTLSIESTPNQDTPVMQGKRPILGVDVWEHAYYLHYQNKRPDYVTAWFNTINWDVVAQKYAAR